MVPALLVLAAACAEEAVNDGEEGVAEKQGEEEVNAEVEETVSAVLELDSDEFEAALKSHPLLLVGPPGPWLPRWSSTPPGATTARPSLPSMKPPPAPCRRSQPMSPIYPPSSPPPQEGSPVRLAKVNAITEKVLAKREGVRRGPSSSAPGPGLSHPPVVRGRPLPRPLQVTRPLTPPRQGRESLPLLHWIRSKTSAVAVEVTSDPQAKDLIAGSKVAPGSVRGPRWSCSACSPSPTPRGSRCS